MLPLEPRDSAVFDPETLALMKSSLDAAWSQLNPVQQARASKINMAEKILKAAARGERDPMRLRASALLAAR
jgi:hypothetical protein